MELKEITTLLLQSDDDAECRQAAGDLYTLFSGIVKLNDEVGSPDQVETHLGEGKALSPVDAARCILDYMRIRSYLRGMRAAINEAQKRFPTHTIQILYAGCGPYAPLVLPLITQFSSAEVQFTLLDIHKRSLDAVRQIVQVLGASDYVRDFVQCDAASHTFPFETDTHILVIETMQRALEKEPQVAITRNLVSRLRSGGILVPEKIVLSACLADASREVVTSMTDSSGSPNSNGRNERIDLGALFELTAEGARQPWKQYAANSSGKELCSPTVRIRLPLIPNSAVGLMILTNITVFDSILLRDYESGLTYPTVLFDTERLRSHDQVEFQYVTGASPGLRWRVV